MTPQGRLTLESNKPIMGPNVFSSSVYYTPFIGNSVPTWDGSGAFVDRAFSELSLSLSGTQAGKIYDVFASGSTPSLSLGTAWTSLAARAVPVSLVQGVWCESGSYRTYLGSVYTHAAGMAKFQTRPPRVPYGSANILGLYNAYQRVRTMAVCQDSNTSWSYANSGVRFADNSNAFRVYWLDGLAQSQVSAEYQSSVAGQSGSNAAATVGVIVDANYPLSLFGGSLNQAALNSTALGMMVEGRNWSPPLLGLHYWQAVEQSTVVPIMFYGNDFSALSIELDC